MRFLLSPRVFGLALALPLLAACSDDNTGGTTAPDTQRTYSQIERLGNPLVSEVFFMKRDHGLANSTAPATDVANGFGDKIKAFTNAFNRGPTIANTLAAVLVPDMLMVFPNRAGNTSGWLSWALANGYGGRNLKDDVVDAGLTAIFGRLLDANATVLPDGRVIVIGGSQNGNIAGNNFDDSQSVLESELWSPSTETFKSAAIMKTPRNYHSSALLLPDGRVLSAGGGGCGGPPIPCLQNHYSAEIYYPPYLFKTDGSGRLAERPMIALAPATVGYNANFEVSSPDAAITSSAVLMHLGSATHAFDQGQFRVPLQIESRGGGLLGLRSPANANIAPPGVYMLFIIDAAGVPSDAKMIKLQ